MKKAFTLIEAMIVVVVIGLLAAMVIPIFMKVRENRQKSWSPNQTQTRTVEYKRIVIDGKTYKLVPE